MVSRLLLIYAVVELAVIFALVSTIGWGWTLLALLATFVLGLGHRGPDGGFAPHPPDRPIALRVDRTTRTRPATARWSVWPRSSFSFPGW